MDRKTFSEAVQIFRRRSPFRPFTVVMIGGNQLEVDHPDAILERDGAAFFFAPGGIPVLFDFDGVSELVGDLAGRADIS